MASICLYFQVHQPSRLKQYSFFNIGNEHHYFDDELNKKIIHKIAENCYLPTNALLTELIDKYKRHFRVAFSISGNVIEQFEQYRPDVLESFKNLAKTGCVEFLSETYHHSLSSVFSEIEFSKQVEQHREKILEYFGQIPQVFRNTECIYSNEIGKLIYKLGYKYVLTEGVGAYLNTKSENFVYQHPELLSLKLLLRNSQLTDDIAFKFSDRNWSQFPLTAQKYVSWLEALSQRSDCINLFMDYETFGEHQSKDKGIFEFLTAFPECVFNAQSLNFRTPTEVFDYYPTKGIYDIGSTISWADEARDLSAWSGNEMQKEALRKIYSLEHKVAETRNKRLYSIWAKLQNSDHFYYMSTKDSGDGAVHQYFSPYNSPYDAYIFYMNILADFEMLVKNELHYNSNQWKN